MRYLARPTADDERTLRRRRYSLLRTDVLSN